MNYELHGKRIIVRGAGEMASGVIRRLRLAGFDVLALEIGNPDCIRRTVCFAEAIHSSKISIEGVTGQIVNSIDEAKDLIDSKHVPVLIDPAAKAVESFRPDILIDARMLKEATDSSFMLAPVVIGLGPGFLAGKDCHAVIETNRGFNLGRVIYEGPAEKNTGLPGMIASESARRILRAPRDGAFKASAEITDMIAAGQIVGHVDDEPVIAEIDGCLRGLIHAGCSVTAGKKIGDIDPRGKPEYCYKISDKANAIAGGVLEAVLSYFTSKHTI